MKNLKNIVGCVFCGGVAKVNLNRAYMSSPLQYDATCTNCRQEFKVREPDLAAKEVTPLETVKIKKLHPDAITPTRTHSADAGLDLYASEDTWVSEGTLIPTGIAAEIPPGYEATVRPRSGLTSRSSLRVQLGTVDSGFTGEIKVIADSIAYQSGHFLEYYVVAGDKIAQLVISPIALPEVQIVEEFEDETERGASGFGSTGSQYSG